MRTAKLGLRCLLTLCVALGVAAAPVGAESEISIPFDDLIFGSPGSVIQVAEVPVDADLVGRTCRLSVVAENQSSVHIGNDLIVSTGSSQAVVLGVEDTPNGGTLQTFEMVVGPTIVVEIRIGQDGMSSLGFGLSFDCELPAPDLGQQVESTTTTVAPTTVAPTTVPPTTVPPTTAPPTTVPVTEASTPATVAGAVTSGLPQAPPARAVTGSPAYTG